ncbi:uncharacterized protein LOC132715344 [Ruditapes philippinarum]|uniref:uncharacterized protein LOC132715344 n=1 Tax=Ruditapes philippinarum TaxID=129788 RepID=UPI00295C1E74|nr:uncharacterized protein LOC132715344 [Ruditapes philippinarum]XP_060554318.1 uncharacterized protein LOC132715344 [Ruditapes philippinarum]XP_060554319.1 uncharacterized protein LOC132715344 [Ruditapes philippinarum]
MAVSGRKQIDLLGSVAAGSAEDFDHCCEPCLTTGQHIEAHGFCVTCQEYLCKNCHDVHRKTKVSRNHQILQRYDFDKIQTTRKSNNECTEMCQVHEKEIIKFYCPSHHALVCNDCIVLGHRTCKVDYIPEKCVGIADGTEFGDVMQKLGEKLKEASEISKKAKSSRSNINDYSKEIIKAITEFRKEINDRLDLMQKDALNNAEEIKSNNNKIIQHVLDTCENTISGIKCLQSSLHASKSNHEDGQLYIDMKRAESTLKSYELNDAEQTLMHTNMHYSFQRNSELETLFCKKMVFGESVNHSRHESTKVIKAVDRLIEKGDINVKTSSDKMTCHITGCAVLNTNKLVLADWENKKVKLISIENKRVQEEKALDSGPCDIAVMSQDLFAVTMPYIKEIVVMTTDDKLSCVRSIKVDRQCYCIDFNQDCLYVACLSPPSVIVLNTPGDILNNISLNFLSPDYIPYIAVRKDSKLLYISDFDNDNITSVSLQGKVTATYKHTDLSGPCGMLMLDDGALLVCCYKNGTIHKVNGDLKHGKIMYKGEDGDLLQSICHSSRYAEIYVGCIGDQLKVLNTQ